MKYQAKISGKKQAWAELEPNIQKEWSFEKRPGGAIIATHREGKRIRFYYTKNKNQFWAKINATDFFGDKNPLIHAGAKNTDSDYTAQFPGKVRKIMVASDQKVEAGTPLLMIEAMKMEFAIKAASPGVVKAILVKEGDILLPGQKLIDFEATA